VCVLHSLERHSLDCAVHTLTTGKYAAITPTTSPVIGLIYLIYIYIYIYIYICCALFVYAETEIIILESVSSSDLKGNTPGIHK